jgi:hypothetical protein
MNEEKTIIPSRDEARAALAEVDSVLAQTRISIAEGHIGPELILWGSLWLLVDLLAQFVPAMFPYCGAIIWCGGLTGSWILHKTRSAPIRPQVDWRLPCFWLALMGFAALWIWLLVPKELLPANLTAQDYAILNRRGSAFWQTIPMFAYVVIGLWVERFFIWLGLIVAALIVGAYLFLPDYFYLASGVAAGGSLILSAFLIKKFWK